MQTCTFLLHFISNLSTPSLTLHTIPWAACPSPLPAPSFPATLPACHTCGHGTQPRPSCHFTDCLGVRGCRTGCAHTHTSSLLPQRRPCPPPPSPPYHTRQVAPLANRGAPNHPPHACLFLADWTGPSAQFHYLGRVQTAAGRRGAARRACMRTRGSGRTRALPSHSTMAAHFTTPSPFSQLRRCGRWDHGWRDAAGSRTHPTASQPAAGRPPPPPRRTTGTHARARARTPAHPTPPAPTGHASPPPPHTGTAARPRSHSKTAPALTRCTSHHGRLPSPTFAACQTFWPFLAAAGRTFSWALAYAAYA